MTMARHDPLFHGPRTMLAGLKQFLVVIGFDDERVHLPEPFDQHLGRVTEVGDEAEPAATGMKRITNRLHRVMRDGEGLNRDITDREVRPGPKEPPIAMLR